MSERDPPVVRLLLLGDRSSDTRGREVVPLVVSSAVVWFGLVVTTRIAGTRLSLSPRRPPFTRTSRPARGWRTGYILARVYSRPTRKPMSHRHYRVVRIRRHCPVSTLLQLVEITVGLFM
jgi:hypothetical protein